MKRSVIGLLVFSVVGCSPHQEIAQPNAANEQEIVVTPRLRYISDQTLKLDSASSPMDAAACKKAGGEWRSSPGLLPGEYSCIGAPLADAGKTCSDARDCIGNCIASDDLDAKTGTCQPTWAVCAYMGGCAVLLNGERFSVIWSVE